MRSYIQKPFKFDFQFNVSNKGFADAITHPCLSPNVPFHMELASDGSFGVNTNIEIKSEQLPSYFQKNSLMLGLYGTEMNKITALFGVKHSDIVSLSLTVNPILIGFTYHGKNFGFEAVHSVEEEQPSASLLFNKTFRRTEVSLMASMYGALTALVTSNFDKFKFSTLFEANVFTFQSSTAFGITFPFYSSYGHLSYSLPSKTINIEFSLNREKDENSKTGVTIFAPIQLNKILRRK